MFNLYWTLGIAVLSGIIGLFTGYRYEEGKYDAYKQSVVVAQKVAEIETKRKEEEAKNVTSQINQAYQDDINNIRQYYAGQLRNATGGSPMSILSDTTIGSHEASSNPVLAYQCAETTQQLIDLQNWVTLQQSVK